jgi:hypothetical protein
VWLLSEVSFFVAEVSAMGGSSFTLTSDCSVFSELSLSDSVGSVLLSEKEDIGSVSVSCKLSAGVAVPC